MALRYFDGFDYASVAEMNTRGLSASTGGSGAGFYYGASPAKSLGTSTFAQTYFLSSNDGYGYCNAGNSFSYYQDSQGTWVIGFNWSSLQTNNFGSGGTYGFLVLKDSGTIQGQLNMYQNANGFFYTQGTSNNICDTGAVLIGGTGSTTIGNAVFPPWIYVELKVVFHPTAGSVEIRVNGNPLAKTTNVNTISSTNNSANTMTVGLITYGGSYGVASLIDDLYICDGTGASSNDFLGPCKVETNFPLSDGSLSQWTPNTGTTGYNLVNETSYDSDTTYLSSSTTGQTELFKFRAQFTGRTVGMQVINVSRLDANGL